MTLIRGGRRRDWLVKETQRLFKWWFEITIKIITCYLFLINFKLFIEKTITEIFNKTFNLFFINILKLVEKIMNI